MTLIMAVDPGLANFGLVMIDESTPEHHRCLEVAVFHSEPLGKKLDVALADDRVRRCRDLYRWLDARPRPDACAAEAMSFPRGAKAIASISLAWGILIAVLESKRIPLVTAHPKTWRRAICRSGSEADSHAAAMALVPSYADFESSIVKGQREHARDALGVFCWSLHTDVVRSVLGKASA